MSIIKRFRNSETIKQSGIYFLFFILAFILRFFSFFPSLIDHDESTYLVIAKEILKGEVLYTDITDIKPVGIFYVTAAFIKIFGNSIFGFRVFGAFIISLTSFLLYKTKLKIGHPKNVALASGIIYIFFLSVWTHYGIAVNTEHFFNLLTVLAIFILFSGRRSWRLPAAGFIVGLGFLIKIVVAFDVAAIFLFLFIADMVEKKLTIKKLSVYALSGVLFFIPFGLVNLAFYLTGHFDDFYQINYVAFRNYAQQKNFVNLSLWILEFIVRFLPIFLLFFWSLFSKQKIKNIAVREKLFVSIWFVFCLISVLMPGKRFSHYLIQMMLPVSFLAANIFHREIIKPVWLKTLFTRKIGYPLLIVLIGFNVLLQKKDYYDKMDCPREVTSYLKDIVERDDVIYTGNAQQIIYFLLDISPPSKYVHPSLLFVETQNITLGIDPEKELKVILNKKPRFILIRKDLSNNLITEALSMDYSLVMNFTGCEIKIYERNSIR